MSFTPMLHAPFRHLIDDSVELLAVFRQPILHTWWIPVAFLFINQTVISLLPETV